MLLEATFNNIDPEAKRNLRNVKAFRFEKMHSDTTKRLLVCLSDRRAEEVLMTAIEEAMTTELWIGSRSAGYLEKRGQELIGGSLNID